MLSMPDTANKQNIMKSAKTSVDKFKASWDYAQKNHHQRWSRNWSLYNNKRTNVSYEGITNTFVPMTFSSVETITAALGAGRPSIDFVPQDMYKYIMNYYESGKKPDLKALNAQFDYFWECDNWDLKSIKTIRSGLIYGTATEYVYWDGDKPRIINLSVRDAIIDPNLSDPMQLITHPKDFYSGRRYMTTKTALENEELADPETGKLKKRYKNLEKVRPGYGATEHTEKEVKEMLLGSVGENKDLIEIIEINDGEHIISIANRCVTIEKRPNIEGIHNLVIHRFIADENVIYGKSIIDPIAAPQELLNDVTNQSVDAVTDQLMPNWELDPMYLDALENLTTAPGTIHPFKPGSLQQVAKNPISPQAFNERQNMKNEIREATAADQIIQGVAGDGNATATEINTQVAQAGQRFGLYVRMLEKEAFYQRAKIVYTLMLRYVKDKQLIPIISMDGPKFRQYDPSQFDDTYEPKIQLEASVKLNQSQTSDKATMAFQAIIQDPTNDLWEAKKILYAKMFDLNEEELDRIIGATKPEQPGMAPAGALPEEGAPVGEELPIDPNMEQLPPELPPELIDIGAIQGLPTPVSNSDAALSDLLLAGGGL